MVLIIKKEKALESFDSRACVGAANQSRTDDLMLTKHVLYQLSHSSVSHSTIVIIPQSKSFVNTFLKVFLKKLIFSKKLSNKKHRQSNATGVVAVACLGEAM